MWQTAKVAYHLLAQIVTARLADVTLKTRNSRFDCHHVAHLNILHSVAYLHHLAARFVSWSNGFQSVICLLEEHFVAQPT